MTLRSAAQLAMLCLLLNTALLLLRMFGFYEFSSEYTYKLFSVGTLLLSNGGLIVFLYVLRARVQD